jgi:hypothetical protein
LVGYGGVVDALADVVRDLLLYALLVLSFLGPIEAFLRFRLWCTSRRGAGGVYLARWDPWVSAVVALAGLGAITLIRALS